MVVKTQPSSVVQAASLHKRCCAAIDPLRNSQSQNQRARSGNNDDNQRRMVDTMCRLAARTTNQSRLRCPDFMIERIKRKPSMMLSVHPHNPSKEIRCIPRK